jgi:hypothetical protein
MSNNFNCNCGVLSKSKLIQQFNNVLLKFMFKSLGRLNPA